MSIESDGCVYGPVPSRRLGRSLGIDLVPLKTCTYDCVYCQLGRTTNKILDRREFVDGEKVLGELERKLYAGDVPDAVTLAGSGEPTLHRGIGRMIREIKRATGIRVAVLTNGSLLWRNEVQDALADADIVLPSLDAGDEYLFRYVNRPREELSFEQVVCGMRDFTKGFSGQVWLEVFLLAGVTGVASEARRIADLARHIAPARVQMNTVSRPPAEPFAYALPKDRMLALKAFFPGPVEILGGPEADGAAIPGLWDPQDEEILAVLRRRPCTCADLAAGLRAPVPEMTKRLGAMVSAGRITAVAVDGRTFYVAAGSGGGSIASGRK